MIEMFDDYYIKYSNVNKCCDLFSMNKQDNVVFGITANISVTLC